MLHALVVDDEVISLRFLTKLIEAENFRISTARTLLEARHQIHSAIPDLVLLDLMLPDGSGMDLLREMEPGSESQVVLITGHASVETAVEALRLGASDYLTKPVDTSRLKTILSHVRRTCDLKEEVSNLRDKLRNLGHFGPLLGSSPAMQKVYEQIMKVAPTEATVLATGESGTGKELVAQALHQFSRRHHQPYLPMNCSAISPSLIESELFGHEEGSFTGASRLHRGYFERADGGTLFLDEITEMPIELQVKLLRVLETGTFMRIGGDREVKIDVRVIAATNRNPEEAVVQGKLREDLLYRLNVFRIDLPPLRERGDDVELLAEHFLAQFNRTEGTSKRFSPVAIERLRVYNWAGNVRELKNLIHRAFILGDSEITPECLAPGMKGAPTVAMPQIFFKVGVSMAEVQRRLILATLDSCSGDKKKTAEILGISLRTLYNRLDSYKMDQSDKKVTTGRNLT
jgi:two-component system response regulator AtoC